MTPDMTKADDTNPDGLRIHFEDGLLGFPDTTDYTLSPGPSNGLFWLEGALESDPRFLLADPFVFFEGFELELSADQAARISATDATQVGVLAIAVPSQAGEWTANLQGPLVINVDQAIGAQLVRPGEASVRRAFSPVLAGAA